MEPTARLARPWRWAQLTLVEDDPGKYDPAFWLDYFRRVGAEGACLSAGGCVAFYPSRIPLHHRSVFLGDRDPFGELVAGCRGMDMTVLARTDPHAFHQDVADAHPDWIAADAEGKPRGHWADPAMWVACPLGPYGFEFMDAVHREIMEMYRVDGIFVNRWEGSGTCWCAHCRTDFLRSTGLEMPRPGEPSGSPVWRAYALWRQEKLFELWDRWDVTVRSVDPGARLVPNAGGGEGSFLDMVRVAAKADFLAADRQARSGLAAPWAAGRNGKEYRATLGSKPVAGLFSVGLEEQYRWKDSVQTEAEIRIWVADAVAQGMRPWFTKFSGRLHDRRWLKIVEDIFVRHRAMGKYLHNVEPLADVGLVFSQRTFAIYGGDRERVEDHGLGMYQALVEARIPFEMVHDGLLDPDRLEHLKLLILPNIAVLSDSQCGQLADFVGKGGGLVATHETSLYGESGERRKDFGLADIFGVSFGGKIEERMQNSYLKVVTETGHPLLAGLADAGRIINGAKRIEVAPRGPLPPFPLTLIPSYPDLPMEKVYPRTERPDQPGVVVRDWGRGRVVYFPWDIDRTFREVMAADHGRLLGNAFGWAAGGEPPVVVTGPGLLDVAVWRQEGSLTVHMVNLTNPMAMRGPYRELIPLSGQSVRVRLPAGTRPRGVRFLVSGIEPVVRESGGWLSADVPPILDHEVLAVDL